MDENKQSVNNLAPAAADEANAAVPGSPAGQADGAVVPEVDKKEENKPLRTFLKVLMWVLIIAVVIFVVLFISARVADDLVTIPNLIQYLIDEYNGLH